MSNPSTFLIVTFHGVITEQWLQGYNGRGYVHLWLAIRSTLWQRKGTPCTFVFTDDIDHAMSVTKGEIVYQSRMHALPGHLQGVSHKPDEAIDLITRHHFRGKQENKEWLYRLTQEGREVPIYNEGVVLGTLPVNDGTKIGANDAPVCTCPVSVLMTSGCQCGSIPK